MQPARRDCHSAGPNNFLSSTQDLMGLSMKHQVRPPSCHASFSSGHSLGICGVYRMHAMYAAS